MLQLCIGYDFPHYSAVLTPNNESNLHFSATSFVVESIAKYTAGKQLMSGETDHRGGEL